ncbi:CAP domain-containing protein [Marinithermus hydrothermalis]|uniref:CAP domain-containing protein n=1 Tax=Marinithermus hydrothermalis TaxID=186192 RepID=UPI0005A2A87B|nr:CAP domain-containing protein [Marinithermus hydrothermalis]
MGNLTVQYAPASSGLYATPPDVPNCLEGSLTDEAKQRALYTLNFIRALVGLPPVGYDPASDPMVQKASLMFAANNAIDHFPPTSWACYTAEGAEGAKKSNLAIKSSSAPITPLPGEFIVLWADDVNVSKLGHRRWLVDPFLKHVAFGLVDGSPLVGGAAFSVGSAIRVIYAEEADISNLALPFVAYPRGEFPTALLTNDWFFSFGVLADPSGRFNNGDVDYSQAQIRVTDPSGAALSVTEVSFTDPNPTSVMGLPNHLQWKVPGLQDGVTYTVTITNVRVNGTPQDFSYTVHLR